MICINVVNTHPIITGKHDPTMSGKHRPAIDNLVYLDEKGHNPGGVHAAFRSLRAFLYWREDEYEREGWKNPIREVKAPKLSLETFDPVNINDITMMLDTCSSDFHGFRDAAILLALLDTVVRALELCSMNIQDYDQFTG